MLGRCKNDQCPPVTNTVKHSTCGDAHLGSKWAYKLPPHSNPSPVSFGHWHGMRVILAFHGRVPCRLCATPRRMMAGDQLTASFLPGAKEHFSSLDLYPRGRGLGTAYTFSTQASGLRARDPHHPSSLPQTAAQPPLSAGDICLRIRAGGSRPVPGSTLQGTGGGLRLSALET